MDTSDRAELGHEWKASAPLSQGIGSGPCAGSVSIVPACSNEPQSFASGAGQSEHLQHAITARRDKQRLSYDRSLAGTGIEFALSFRSIARTMFTHIKCFGNELSEKVRRQCSAFQPALCCKQPRTACRDRHRPRRTSLHIPLSVPTFQGFLFRHQDRHTATSRTTHFHDEWRYARSSVHELRFEAAYSIASQSSLLQRCRSPKPHLP